MPEPRDPVTTIPHGSTLASLPGELSGFAAALVERYALEREIGRGGMATVFLARDLKHHRRVALKVVRPELSAVLGGQRFLQEIRTTANLQHPHILPLHDSGEADGLVFYVMPFVEGESLRDRLLREKQLPVGDAVRIAREVASALDYAHRQGVVHRDIKPENVLLHDGQALVADFGIALAASRSDGATRMTETGMSLGTPHYMAPEQAMGERDITAKADVYALGAMLYEMLIGEPPFTGPTAQAIVARVMTEEPRALTLQRKTIPPAVDAAVRRALEKLPADRFASAREFAEALESNVRFSALGLQQGVTTGLPLGVSGDRTPSGKRRALPLLLAAGVALASGTMVFLAGRATVPKPEQPLAQFVVELPDSVVSVNRCCGGGLALSPDGRTLVFAASKLGGGGLLYRRDIGRLEAEPVPGTEGASVPFFSPDGQWVGFFSEGRLRKVPLAGGAPVTIATVDRVREASWGSDDQIVFGGPERRIFIVAAGGGTPRALTERDSASDRHAPFLIPGSRFALITMRRLAAGNEGASIGLLDLTSGRIDTIGLGMRAQYAMGHLLYTTIENTLFAQPFDPREGKTTGDPVPIVEDVVLIASFTHEFAVSPGGSLVFQPVRRNPGSTQLILEGPAGQTPISLPLTGGQLAATDPTFSPDGRRIALRLWRDGSGDLWLFDRQNATLDRFTIGGAFAPVWSRDGRRIVYSTDAGLVVRAADQTGAPELILRGTSLHPGSWLPDGRSVVFQANLPTRRWDIGIVTLGDSVPRWLVATDFAETHPQVSPDGKLLAYTSTRTGRPEVYVQPLAGDGPRVQVSAEGGDSPRWSPDGRTLYFADLSQRAIVAAALERDAEVRVVSRRKVLERPNLDVSNWDVHPNGKDLLYLARDSEGAAPRLVWIQNWTELVRQTGGTP